MSVRPLTRRQRELLLACPLDTASKGEWMLVADSARKFGLVTLEAVEGSMPLAWRVTVTEAGEHALATGYRSVLAPTERIERDLGGGGTGASQTGGGSWCNPHKGRTR